MVRHIDTDKTLTVDEYRYLRDRESLPTAYAVEKSNELTDDELSRIEADARKLREIESVRQQRNLRPMTEDPSRYGLVSKGGDGEDDDEDVSGSRYGSWNVDELREELDDRGLSQQGRKADLVARLEADDSDETTPDED